MTQATLFPEVLPASFEAAGFRHLHSDAWALGIPFLAPGTKRGWWINAYAEGDRWRLHAGHWRRKAAEGCSCMVGTYTEPQAVEAALWLAAVAEAAS